VPDSLQMIILEKKGYYFYLHQEVYDQAVILIHTYHDTEYLIQKLELGDHNNATLVQWFAEEAPHPLHILAPFLALSERMLPQDMEACCAVLHEMSTSIHFQSYIEQPAAIRKQAKVTGGAGTDQPMAWERFFLMSHPYELVVDTYTLADLHYEEDAVEHEPADTEATSILAGFSRVQEDEATDAHEEGRVSTLAERQQVRKLLESI